MEIRNNFFVDSNFFVAFFNEQDSLHIGASNIMRLLEAGKIRFLITDYIFLETVTVLSQRTNRDRACKAGFQMLNHPYVSVVNVDEILHQQSWHIFQEVGNKDISFVDCSILAVMQAEQVKTLLTFDKHFKKLKSKYRFQLYDLDNI